MAQRDGPLEFVVVVLRAVNLTATRRIGDRRVDEYGRGRETTIDGGRIHDWLERRSKLPVGLHRAIELAAAEAPSSHHRADLTGSVVDRHERRFGEWCLLEGD